MNNLIATLVIMLLCITALAQQRGAEDAVPSYSYRPAYRKPASAKQTEKPVAEQPANAPAFVSPISVQVLAGTQGFGADVKYGFKQKFSGRAGFGIIPLNASRGFNFSTFPVNGALSARFSNLHLLADYAPLKSNFFRIVGGVAYFIKGNANVLVVPESSYTIGSQTISKEQLGVVRATVAWKGPAPYLGMAVFRPFPNRFFNVNLDIGTYYVSSPSTSFVTSNLITNTDQNAKQFNQNMHGYCWLPVVQLNFNFRLK